MEQLGSGFQVYLRRGDGDVAKIVGQQGQPGLHVPTVAIPFQETLDRTGVTHVVESWSAAAGRSAQTHTARKSQKGGTRHYVGAAVVPLIEEERGIRILRPPCRARSCS